MLSQFHHAVLDDIERCFFVSHVINAALESPFFNAFQEVRKFLFSCQRFEVPVCPALVIALGASRVFCAYPAGCQKAACKYDLKLSHYNGTRPVLVPNLQPLNNAKCHNVRCNSKGKRVMARRIMFLLMVMASSFDAAP